MQCCLELFGKHCIEYWSVQCYLKSIKTTLNRIFLMQSCLELLGQYCIGLLPVQCCPKSIKTTLDKIFSYSKLPGASRTILHSFDLCNVDPRVLRKYCTGFFYMQSRLQPLGQNCIEFSAVQCYPEWQHWTKFFLMQCYLESFWQHCIEFWPVQCCPKSIKATLHRIFSYAMLSGAFWATLYRYLTSSVLLQ